MAGVEAIVKGCEALTHSEQVREMVNLGQLSKSNIAINTLVLRLSSGSLDEQVLALETCYGSRNVDIALKSLASSSKYLKKRAMGMISLLGTDGQVLDALKSAPEYLQIRTLRRLKGMQERRRRQSVIDTFLEELGAKVGNNAILRTVFPLGSGEFVERNVGQWKEHFSSLDWRYLSKYHPDIARKAVKDIAAHSGLNDPILRGIVTIVITTLIKHHCTLDVAMEVFKEMLHKISIESFPIPQLAAKCPEKTVQIILDSKDDISTDVMSSLGVQVIQKLPMDLFLPLFTRYPCIATKWNFKDLTPEQRLAVYQAFGVGWRNDNGTLDKDIVASLPKVERIAEAYRHLKLPVFEVQPVGKVPYIAFLPWDEALPLQTPFLQDSDANIRGPALRAQIGAAKWDEDNVSRALKVILYRKNEQDPVKTDMMLGLAQIPVGRWREEHLEDLAQIVKNTLDSGDTSGATVRPLLNMVTDLTPKFPEWSKTQLEMMMRDWDEMPHWDRPSGIVPVKQTMVVISEAMSPKLKKLLANKNGHGLWALAAGFDTNTKYWTELLDTCEASLKVPEMLNWRASMITILKTHQPKTWHRIIPALISEDTETSGLPVLLDHVHRRQQTLLWDNYLHGKSWWTKNALCRLDDGFFRWTAAQQAAFASLLLTSISSNDQSNSQKCRAITQLGLLSYQPTTPLVEIANDNERPVLQEAALRTLGRLDGDAGVPVLIEALGDQRARIAIYALRSRLKTMSKSGIMALLKSVPQGKITVAKETLRLIGDLDMEDAFQYLLSRDKDDLHPDVRVALFRALWGYINREETWAIFNRAASNPDPVIAKGVVNIPEDGMSTSSRAKLLQLMNTLLSHPSAPLRLAALQRLIPLPLQDPAGTLFPTLLTLITTSKLKDEIEAAARAIFRTYSVSHSTQIKALYETLIARQERKVLQRVHAIYLESVSPTDSYKSTRPTTHLILSVLAQDRLSVTRRVETLFSALPWAEIRPHLFAIIPELHADALVEAEGSLEYGGRWMREGDMEDLRDAEVELGSRHGGGAGGGAGAGADETARRLALSLLIRRVNEDRGWNREQRARLEVYRADESVCVAEKAWGIEAGDEDEGDDNEGKGMKRGVVTRGRGRGRSTGR